MTSQNPDMLPEIQKLYESSYGIKFELITGERQLAVKADTHYGKEYKIVTGFLENSLHQKFPNAITTVYLANGRDDVIVLVEAPNGLYRFTASTKNIFSTSIFGFVAWMVGTSRYGLLPHWLRSPRISVRESIHRLNLMALRK